MNRLALRTATVAAALFLTLGAAAFATGQREGTSQRAPGTAGAEKIEAITGNVSLSQQQQAAQTLAQAAALENENQLGEAAQLYDKVLAKDPKNEVALAQLGWLEYEIGQNGADASLIADGRAKLEQAVKLNPDDYAVRLYLGTVLLQTDHDAAGAVAQYERFLAADPPGAVLAQAAPTLRQAYAQAGVPVPAQVPAP
jgi:tetratricopeptide (TPR) repeat protein